MNIDATSRASLASFVNAESEGEASLISVLSAAEFVTNRVEPGEVVVYGVECEKADAECSSSFIVAGDLPYMWFSRKEIETPEEALLLWAWFVSLWISKSGRRLPLGDLPVLRRPNFDAPLDIFTDDKAWLLKRYFNVLYGVLPTCLPRIRHPELVTRCKRLGVPGSREPESR